MRRPPRLRANVKYIHVMKSVVIVTKMMRSTYMTIRMHAGSYRGIYYQEG